MTVSREGLEQQAIEQLPYLSDTRLKLLIGLGARARARTTAELNEESLDESEIEPDAHFEGDF